jgi:phosphatidylglycerol:prolipoprotein diacylglycerol transferase
VPTLLPVLPVIELAFDPIAQIGDWHVRLQTLALAAVILVALLIAAAVARRTPVDVSRSPDDGGPDGEGGNHLRRDDLLYIAIAAIPGAVLGGRLGYWLVHAGYYSANPGAILDIGQGGFELAMAVAGGTLTASVVASLLGAPVGRWLHAMILPLLLALAGGKASMILGGQGQGVPWEGPWATAYLGPGPWLSLAPAIPSHPSQAYESLATLLVAAVIAALVARGAFARKAGGAFFLGIGLWAIARVLVAFTWRDPAVIGPFGTDQVLTIGVAIVALLLLVIPRTVGIARERRGGAGGTAGSGSGGSSTGIRTTPGGEPDWPDPGTRPRI